MASILYDVVVVGGGPAGLSAALMLGRCRRRVIVVDDGRPRNAPSQESHGFFTRDGSAPPELRRHGREQLVRYGVEVRAGRVEDARRDGGRFVVTVEGGDELVARRLLLATGLRDQVPAIEGIRALYGLSVFHCPYCDGWEVREQPLAAYGRGREGAEHALALLDWSDDVILCTDGARRIPAEMWEQLRAQGIRVRTEPIARLEGENGVLRRIVFRDGDAEPRRALFFHTGTEQRSDLAARLGCRFTRGGAVRTGPLESTGVDGLFVAGDASHDVKWIAVAAAEGAKAAFAINKSLRDEDLPLRAARLSLTSPGPARSVRARRRTGRGGPS